MSDDKKTPENPAPSKSFGEHPRERYARERREKANGPKKINGKKLLDHAMDILDKDKDVKKSEKFSHDHVEAHFNKYGSGQVYNNGEGKPDHTKSGLPHGQYELKEIPVKNINPDSHESPLGNIDPRGDTGNEKHAEKYSKLNTDAPAIIVKPHPTKPDHYVTIDGVHRARSAHLRGQAHIKAYVHTGNEMKKSEWTNEPVTLTKTATAGHTLNTANQVGAAATEGLVHKPMATGENASKIKAKFAKLQAKKELESKNPNENWDKHLVNKTEESMKIEDLKKMAEELQKRSKNVRRELARINSGKKGDAKAVERETKYLKDKIAVDETHSLPSEQDLAEKHYGDRKATDKVTPDQKREAKWKDNKAGLPIRKPEISMKDGKQSITHMPTPKSVRHETAHAVRADGSLSDLNSKMQGGYGKVKSTAAQAEKKVKAAGGSEAEIDAARQKGNPHAYQGEYETNGVENAIARRTGSLPPRNTAQRTRPADLKAYGKGPKDERDAPQIGMNGAKKDKPIHKLVPEHTAMESSVVRRDRQAKEKASAKKQGKEYVKPSEQTPKMVHIASITDNVRPEIKTKIEQKLDTGEIKYDKKTKQPVKANNIDAKINARSAGRRDIKDDVASKQTAPQASVNGAPKKKKFKFVKPGEKGERLAASEAGKTVKGLLKSLIEKTSNAKED